MEFSGALLQPQMTAPAARLNSIVRRILRASIIRASLRVWAAKSRKIDAKRQYQRGKTDYFIFFGGKTFPVDVKCGLAEEVSRRARTELVFSPSSAEDVFSGKHLLFKGTPRSAVAATEHG
jgi:hypothetical protein